MLTFPLCRCYMFKWFFLFRSWCSPKIDWQFKACICRECTFSIFPREGGQTEGWNICNSWYRVKSYLDLSSPTTFQLKKFCMCFACIFYKHVKKCDPIRVACFVLPHLKLHIINIILLRITATILTIEMLLRNNNNLVQYIFFRSKCTINTLIRVRPIDILFIDCTSLRLLWSKICTVVIFGLPTGESVPSAVGKPVHKSEIDFSDPFSLYISNLYR